MLETRNAKMNTILQSARGDKQLTHNICSLAMTRTEVYRRALLILPGHGEGFKKLYIHDICDGY